MIFGKHINKYYLRFSWMLLLGVASLFAVDFFQLKIPELYGLIIDGLDPSTPGTLGMDTVLSVCTEMLGIIAIMVLGRFLWRIGFFGSAIRVETQMRDEMFDRCKDLSQQYYQVNKVGDLMSLFTNDLDTINECFGDGMLLFFDALLLGGMSLYKMATLNLTLMLFSLVPLFFMGMVGTIVGKYMQKKWEERQEAFSKLSDYAQETFSGIAVVKAFVSEFKELLRFRKLNRHNEEVNVQFTRAAVLLEISVNLFVQSVICVILGYGGWLVYSGQLSVAQLIMFLSYFDAVIWPVMAVSNLIEMTSRGKASLNRIGKLIDRKPDVADRDCVQDPGPLHGEIEFRHLTFRYPDTDRAVLNDVSLHIRAGERIGVIGKTGCGKTTLVDLLLRIYNVPDGMLFLDGKDINTLPIHRVREDTAYVPQDNFLFSDTIGGNIAFSEGGQATPERIQRAAHIAALDDNLADFSDGYDTVLGERGVTISGGQKQRTSIARAVMKNAAILILDDSVSAVDTGTEKKIIERLREDRTGKTTLLIAHRVSTVEQMDKVLLLDDGRVVDFGTHQQLLERCEEYRTTVELQRLESEIGGMNA